MRSRSWVCSLCALTLVACAAHASILDFRSLEIDLTDQADSRAKAAWSEPDIITVTENGLGWDGDPASLRDGWILTEPLPLGLSWRPPYAVSINVTILPDVEETVLDNGQVTIPYIGDVYVRYSPDMAHWSTWQVLQQGEYLTGTPAAEPGRSFHGTVRVPYSEREKYDAQLQEFALLDVPWRSDEDAACRWIVQKNPVFFEDNLPFIGYVEFLYEGSFNGGRRLESFRAEVTYGMSGLHYAPDDESVYEDRDSRSWSFGAGD
jgi:hypothetical protein